MDYGVLDTEAFRARSSPICTIIEGRSTAVVQTELCKTFEVEWDALALDSGGVPFRVGVALFGHANLETSHISLVILILACVR